MQKTFKGKTAGGWLRNATIRKGTDGKPRIGNSYLPWYYSFSTGIIIENTKRKKGLMIIGHKKLIILELSKKAEKELVKLETERAKKEVANANS